MTARRWTMRCSLHSSHILIAGPILHNREVMPQFADPATYRFDARNLAVGVSIFLIGLLKKCLFADQIGAVVAPGFAQAGTLAMGGAWLAALSYSLQLYFDFSGYSDMAIGLARMLNVRFPLNFNSPYKAQSVIEYWQRWHMSLTRWLTLFLYNPLALAIARRRPALDRRTLMRLRQPGGAADHRHHGAGRGLARMRPAVPDLRPAARVLPDDQPGLPNLATAPACRHARCCRAARAADLSGGAGGRGLLPRRIGRAGTCHAGGHGRTARGGVAPGRTFRPFAISSGW